MSIYVNLEVETENSYPSSTRSLQDFLDRRAHAKKIEGFQTIRFFDQSSSIGVYMFVEGFGSINGEIYIDSDSCRNFKMKFMYDEQGAVRERYRSIFVLIYNIFFDILYIYDKDSSQKLDIRIIENDIVRSNILSPVYLFGVQVIHDNGTGIAKTVGLRRFNLKEIAIFFENISIKNDLERIHEILNFAAMSSLGSSKVQNGMPLLAGDDWTNGFKLSIVLVPAKNSIDYKFLSLSCKDELFDHLMIAVPAVKGRRSSNTVRSFTDSQHLSLASSFSVTTSKYQLEYMKCMAANTVAIVENKAKRGENFAIFATSGDMPDMTESKIKKSVYHPSDYDPVKDCFVCHDGRKKILIDKNNIFWWQYSLGEGKIVTPRDIINKVVVTA